MPQYLPMFAGDGSMLMGTQKSIVGAGKWKSAGITPTTTRETPSTTIERPTTDGSLPKRCAQSAWLSTAMRSRPGVSSPSTNVRPTSARTPSSSKNRDVTSA
jgi:hypothetical protein